MGRSLVLGAPRAPTGDEAGEAGARCGPAAEADRAMLVSVRPFGGGAMAPVDPSRQATHRTRLAKTMSHRVRPTPGGGSELPVGSSVRTARRGRVPHHPSPPVRGRISLPIGTRPRTARPGPGSHGGCPAPGRKTRFPVAWSHPTGRSLAAHAVRGLAAPLLLGLLLGAEAAGATPPPVPPADLAPEAWTDAMVEARVDGLLAGLSLEQKVGQLLFVGFGGLDVDPGGAIERLVKGKQVGGVVLFSRNVESLEQVARFTRQLHALLPGVPPFVAVDQEGGNVVRVAEPATALPSAMALGAAGDPDLTWRAGALQARDLRLLGFNMNLAPVLDVNSNPKNPVIGTRSFGEDPAEVGRHGAAYVRGLQGGAVAAVAKHFPGHGDTDADSHYALPSVPHGEARLLEVELRPFHDAIEAGLDAVMTAHMALPAVEGRPGVPATVSRKVLTGLLRERLGFEGIVITDGLEMRGIVEAYGAGPAAVRAIQAGADMVLILWTHEKKEEVHQALLQAARDGRLTRERLDTSVRRILRVKVRRGVFQAPPPLERALAELRNDGAGDRIAREVAERALTWVRTPTPHEPLLGRGEDLVVLSADRAFTQELRTRYPEARIVQTPAVPSRDRRARDLAEARRLAGGARTVVVTVLNGYQAWMARTLAAELEVPVVVVSLGSPYLLSRFPGVDGYLCAYSYRDAAARAAVRVLAGEAEARGRLPVSLPGLYPLGHTAALPAPSGGTGGSAAAAP